jgi:hypothetical protein
MTEPITLPRERCCGCFAVPDTPHAEHCDHARCPECGMQRIQCDKHADSDRPAMWHGVHPDAAVARTRNWWATAVGIDEPVEDYTRVTLADALGMVTWDPDEQRYVIGDVDEARLDQVMRDNGIYR